MSQRASIKQFVSLTGASDKQAQRYLQKAKNNMQNAINLYFDDGGIPQTVETGTLPEIQNLFAKLSAENLENPKVIGDDGFQKILEILKINLENPVIGHLMVNVMHMQKAGQITKANLYNLLKYCRASSLAQVASKIPQLQKQLHSRKDLYKTMYDGLFILYSVTKSPTLDYDIASQLWRVYLASIMPSYEAFMKYVDGLEEKPVKIHKDLWRMVFQFSMNVDAAMSNYSEEDGWPIFLDNFVEFYKKK